MDTATVDSLREQLSERQDRLARALATHGPDPDIQNLLAQVDRALARIGTKDYAQCLVCHEHVGEENLRDNPLLEYCLCNLTRQEQRALEHDLELARRIQAGLLPDPDFLCHGWEGYYHYEPAGVVSGDYCDLWAPPGNGRSIYFAVGDVSGKGVAASLLMAHLQAAFRSLVAAGVTLPEIVQQVNRQLLDAGITSHFATLACGRMSSEGRVEIINAGHCPPLLVRNGKVEELGPTGFPVGMLADKPYEVREFRLAKEDSFILYTDGLSEAREQSGDEYGQERIAELLRREARGRAPRELVHRMRSHLASFTQDAPRLDDLTIMAVRWNG